MRKILILFWLLSSLLTSAQNPTTKYIDSLLYNIEPLGNLITQRSDSQSWVLINRYYTIIDSLLLTIEESIYKDSFNFSYQNKQYNHENFLDFVETKLLEDIEIIQKPDIVDVFHPLEEKFHKTLDSLHRLHFVVGDSSSFIKAQYIRFNLASILNEISKKDIYKSAQLFLNWQRIELQIKDQYACCINGTQYFLRKEPNQYISNIHSQLYYPFNAMNEIDKKIQYSIDLAEFFNTYERKQDAINSLFYFLSNYKQSQYANFNYFRRATSLFFKMSQADETFKNFYGFMEYFTDTTRYMNQFKEAIENTDDETLSIFFSDMFSLLGDLHFDNPLQSSYLRLNPDKTIANEFLKISTKLKFIKQFHDDDFYAKSLVYSLNKSWCNLKYNKDTSSDKIFLDYKLLQDARQLNIADKDKLYEVLDYYCTARIRKNQWEKIPTTIDSFLKKYKYLRSLPQLFYYLQGDALFKQKIHREANSSFKKFDQIYRYALLNDTSIVFSNHQTLLSKYDQFMETFFRTKPSDSENERKSNYDSMLYYGYYSYVNSPDLSFNSEIDKSILTYNYNSEIDLLVKKGDSLKSKFDTAIISFNIQIEKNQILSKDNEFLSDQYYRIQKSLERMKKDTNKLGIEKRALSTTVNRLMSDTVLLNKEKVQLKINNDTLNKRISMKNTELKAKDDEINEKALWVIGLSVVAALLVLTSIFLPTHIYKKRTKHFNKKINDLEEDFENKNYKLRLEKKDAELKLLGNLAYNHDIRKFIPIFPRMIKKTNEFNKALHQKVATAYAKYNKLNNDVVDELLNTVENEIEIVRQSNEVILFLRKMDVTYTLHTNFTDDDELRNILIPKNMFTSFISNSLLHGSIGKKHINIICTIRRVKNGYEFTLEDDGVGFKELGIENKKNDRGIPLLLRQVHNFNEENKIWNLGFDINSIQNKKQGKGVIVTFNMIKI